MDINTSFLLRNEFVNRNPFNNHVVLKSLFKVAPVETLKNFRLVNRLWWKESLPHFRANYRLVFPGDIREVLWENISQYLEWVNEPDDPYKLRATPFHKYDIQRWNFQLNTHVEVLSIFWETMGPLMRQLNIVDCRVYGKADLEKILFDFTPNMEKLQLSGNSYQILSAHERQWEPQRGDEIIPNLNMKELRISLQEELVFLEPEWPEYENSIRSRGAEDYLPISWTSIFKTFPNLKSLQLESIDSDPREYEQEGEYYALNTVLNVMRRQNETTASGLNIERLNIVNTQTNALSSFPRSTLFRLQKLQFPLTFLDLDIGVKTLSADFKKILELYRETLKTLKVYRAPYAEPFANFPFGVLLESLTELQLQGPIVPNLLFLLELPNLKGLRLLNDDHALSHYKRYRAESRHGSDNSDGYDDAALDYNEPTLHIHNTYFSLLKNISLPNLVEFVNGDEICTGEHMSLLSQLMPKLERIRIGVNNDGFKVLCEKWKSTLLELDLTPSNVDDRVLIGDGNGTLQLAKPHNLSDLKYLRRLKMNMIRSDDVICKGLLELPHLTQVNLSCSKEVSDEAFAALSSKFSGCGNCIRHRK